MAAAWESVVIRLVTERGPALRRYAWLLCGNEDDAADLLQDALVKTFGRFGNGFTVAGAEAYVRRTILTLFLDRRRRWALWRKTAHLQVTADSSPAPDPEIGARIDLWNSLRVLAPRERACLVLRYYEDLKIDDIATELGISPGAVKRYVSDGLAKMAIGLDRTAAAPPRGSRVQGDHHAHRS